MAAKKKQTAPQRPWHGKAMQALFADVMAHTRISRKQLAVMLGTDLATLDALEAGAVTPRKQLLQALMPLFAVQRSYHKTKKKTS